jgi:suppressor for copper-sensitivity B
MAPASGNETMTMKDPLQTTTSRAIRPSITALLLGVTLMALLSTSSLDAQSRRMEKASLVAVADRTSYAPGSELAIAAAVTVEPEWHVNSNTPTHDYLIATELELDVPTGWPQPEIVYPAGVMKTFAFADEPISVYDGQFILVARLVVPPEAEPATHEIQVQLRYQACDDRSCLPPVRTSKSVTFEVGQDGELANQEYFQDVGTLIGKGSAPPSSGTVSIGRLAFFLLLGVVGGLLLNAMPCVLPVLSLKLLGLVKSRAQGRFHVVSGSLATAAGILVSFWLLALAAVLARIAGATVGWGVQFQEPTFVTFLTIVILLFCLNLWGVFEVPLPARLANWAAATGGEGLPGHFTAGLFATLLATPCSAPFLGTAVGFALSQSTLVIVATFTAVGVGMALPYLILALAPGLVRVLPRPGPWMDRFRSFMGFLLAAAAVWLLYVLSSQVSRERLAFIELALLLVALFLWMRSKSPRRSPWAVIGVIGLLFSVGGALTLSATSRPPQNAIGEEDQGSKLIPWVAFDREEAEALADRGRLVFVDVTADWCFTCKVNERLVLETNDIAAAFQRYDVVPMKADWTNRDEAISDFLADHGKYGIPFYLLYRPGSEPLLFSELLTKEAVLSALGNAAAEL